MAKYMACKEVVEEGLIVDDGKSINVWSDRWLPKPYFLMRRRCDSIMLDGLCSLLMRMGFGIKRLYHIFWERKWCILLVEYL